MRSLGELKWFLGFGSKGIDPRVVPSRTNIPIRNATTIVLKAMGINDLLHFEFMDPFPTNTMLTALAELYALSALHGEGLHTRLGRKMADYPMEPARAKVLTAGVFMGCSAVLLSHGRNLAANTRSDFLRRDLLCYVGLISLISLSLYLALQHK
jgi:hypothetical protein